MDGASDGRIMLPLTRQAPVIVAIQNAVPIWNHFVFPLVLISSDERKTLFTGSIAETASDQISTRILSTSAL